MTTSFDISKYKLVFAENFDSFRMWGNPGGFWRTTEYWGERNLGRNGESQIYVDPDFRGLGLNPFSVSNGVLSIQANRTSSTLKSQLDGYDYTSGMITSERGFSMQYGYFEIRAQMPEGRGLWPAFWMLALDGKWPPELDVVEVLGHEPDRLFGTSHHVDGAGVHQRVYAAESKGLFDSSDGFHTYGIDWQADKVTWYYDGVWVGETKNQLFDQPMYLLANLAIGGTWAGEPTADTAFPATMKIDHIRAYQKIAEHAIVGTPADWAPIGAEDFTILTADGARRTWNWSLSLGATDTNGVLIGEWARYLTGNDKANYLGGSNAPYNEIDGRRGNDTLFGGPGSDVFIIRNGDGSDVILDVANTAGNTDKIRLDGFHFRHFDDVKAWMRQEGTDVVLRLDEDQALLFKNTSLSKFTPDMFVFVRSVAAPADAPVITPAQTTGSDGAEIGIGTTEAERLDLSGYVVEQHAAAANGTLIKTGSAGTARGTFTGPDGIYRLTVGYLNEDDGAATWGIQVNGKTLNTWTGTGGTNKIQDHGFTLNLETGDTLSITGARGTGELARVDWLKLQPSAYSIGVGTTQAEALGLSGYFIERHAAATNGYLVRTNGTGTATGVFTATDGAYKISVGYVDEDDGAATWSIQVNGRTVSSWTGTGGTNSLQSRATAVTLQTGDTVSVTGTRNSGEFARTDWVKIEATGPSIGLGTTQADTLALSGYARESHAAAADGTLIKTTGFGTAKGLFTGPDGSYRLSVGYLDENDGVAGWSVQVNGRTVGSWTGTSSTNSIESRAFSLDLKTGDQITLTGTKNVGEYARIDWVKVAASTMTMAGSLEEPETVSTPTGTLDQTDVSLIGSPLGQDWLI